jgi:hypothetical protein
MFDNFRRLYSVGYNCDLDAQEDMWRGAARLASDAITASPDKLERLAALLGQLQFARGIGQRALGLVMMDERDSQVVVLPTQTIEDFDALRSKQYDVPGIRAGAFFTRHPKRRAGVIALSPAGLFSPIDRAAMLGHEISHADFFISGRCNDAFDTSSKNVTSKIADEVGAYYVTAQILSHHTDGKFFDLVTKVTRDITKYAGENSLTTLAEVVDVVMNYNDTQLRESKLVPITAAVMSLVVVNAQGTLPPGRFGPMLAETLL